MEQNTEVVPIGQGTNPPTREELENTSTLSKDLYRRLPLEGEAIPILVQPVSIVYGPLEVEEILVAVQRLWTR